MEGLRASFLPLPRDLAVGNLCVYDAKKPLDIRPALDQTLSLTASKFARNIWVKICFYPLATLEKVFLDPY